MSKVIMISMKNHGDLDNKIAAIKAVRGLGGLGLKEAKELVERVNPAHSETVFVTVGLSDDNINEYVSSLKMAGMTVRRTDPNCKVRKAIGNELRKLVTYTTMAAQYDISKALIDVMDMYCPEPSDDFEIKETEE